MAVRYTNKLPVGDYRKGIVIEAIPDSDGLVRTIKVKLMKRDARVSIVRHEPAKMTDMVVAVQRLCVLMPVEEQANQHLPTSPSSNAAVSPTPPSRVPTDSTAPTVPTRPVPAPLPSPSTTSKAPTVSTVPAAPFPTSSSPKVHPIRTRSKAQVNKTTG